MCKCFKNWTLAVFPCRVDHVVGVSSVASSSNAEPAPAPAPTKRSVKRTKSTRSLTSKGKGKARELSTEEADVPQPAADPVPIPIPIPATPASASPKPPKPIEDIERVTADIRTLNATLLANNQIAWVDYTYESHFYENSTLDYVNVPEAAERLVRRVRAEARQATRSRASGPTQTTVLADARDQGRQNGHPKPPPVASTSQATAPSTPSPEPVPELKPAPLKREAAVNWGYPEYYKERIRKAQEAGESTAPIALDYPTADERASVASSSSTAPPPAASTNQSITTNGAAPSGNGNAASAVNDEGNGALPRARLQRWNAVVLGYPEGYTPRNPWPASATDPTGLTSHPDVVRDESGTIILPPHLLAERTAALAASVAPPQPRTPPQPTPVVSRSPPQSSSSNESADLAEVEASISIHLDDGDVHPAADLPSPTAQPSSTTTPPPTSSAASTVTRPAPLTRQHAVILDSRGREIPTHYEDDEEVVQQVIAHVLREVEAERAARPVPPSSTSASRVPITRTEAPPIRASAGMSLFAPAAKSNAKGKSKGKEAAAPTKGIVDWNAKINPADRIFGPKPDKGKKRAREPEPEPELVPAPQLWGYASSTGPMKVRVSLVPVVSSPKRQRVSESEEDGGVAPVEAPATVEVQNETVPAPSEGQALPAGTQHGSSKRSREQFEEGSSRADTDREDEGEVRPAKKLCTRSQ